MRRRVFVVVALVSCATLSCSASRERATSPRTGPEPGVCDGRICGPSGSFTIASFPTTSGVDFTAFPANPSRPYRPSRGGREWWVSPSGRDDADGTEAAPLATVDRAARVARAGDVVWVADGTYRVGTSDDDVAIRLRAPGVTLAAVRPGEARLLPASDAVHYGIHAEADDLIVDGFALSGFTSYPVEFGRAESTQRNVVLKHLRTQGGEAGVSAIDIEPDRPRVDGLLAYDIRIDGPRLIGFNCGIGPCNGMRLEALRIRGAGGDSESSAADGIAVERGDGILVFNVEVTGAEADGIDLKASRATVANAWVHDVGRNGVKLWRGGDVVNALVHDTGADAAVVFEGDGTYRLLHSVVARHNWRRGDAYAATVGYPDGRGRLDVQSSIFNENSGALSVSATMTLDVRSSIFNASANGQELEWGDVVVGEQASGWETLYAAGGGADDRFADPMFTDPDADDYRLRPGSPAVDTGRDTDELPAFDLFGNARVAGAGVDVGPIETPA